MWAPAWLCGCFSETNQYQLQCGETLPQKISRSPCHEGSPEFGVFETRVSCHQAGRQLRHRQGEGGDMRETKNKGRVTASVRLYSRGVTWISCSTEERMGGSHFLPGPPIWSTSVSWTASPSGEQRYYTKPHPTAWGRHISTRALESE